MFTKVLVANRGEIGCRIIRSLRGMGITSVAIYSEADTHSRHVLEADEAYLLGPSPVTESYLAADKIVSIAGRAGAQAIHPGYGFLSENSDFCSQCEEEGIRFIGPNPSHMVDFGLKHRARKLAEEFSVPLLPGSDLLHSVEQAKKEAGRIGYPVMLKSTGGGGGIGMEVCQNADQLYQAYDKIKSLSAKNFKDSGLFLEKYINKARHIEVQIFGDGRGNIALLGDRECSVQRRNQKVIEEAPAPNLSASTREQLHQAAKRLTAGVSYESAGTVEFVVDAITEQFYFLEVNTRLQVEHCVTEEIFGVDLVEWMVLQAAGESPDFSSIPEYPKGAAIEARLYAEDPGKNFQPSTGRVTEVEFPSNIRCDSWISRGTEISGYYDPLLAKIVVHESTRDQAVTALAHALRGTTIFGVETNLLLLHQVTQLDSFVTGKYTTGLLSDFSYHASTIEVRSAGMQTTIQDYPGRLGYWGVGVPPSGPMDNLNHRLANRVVGNPEQAPTLEITVSGPELQFNCDCLIALTGADLTASIDGNEIERYHPVAVKKGSILKTENVRVGQRAYLAIAGGFESPPYMGSRATFILGEFGGFGGRALKAGDILHLGKYEAQSPASVATEHQPALTKNWEIGVLYGPHGAPDFFTKEGIENFFAAEWEVHYNSSRTGVRLVGPTPQWARQDGGEAGLHPSNIHDNAYAIGSIDFTGDMPVILGPDGPSLGGFVCPATIVAAELWKIGQLSPGNTVRFKQLSQQEAVLLEKEQLEFIEKLSVSRSSAKAAAPIGGQKTEPVVKRSKGEKQHPAVVYRRAGDKYLLVEYGELVLDLQLRFRVHALMLQLEKMKIKGVLDLTPGIRSLQIHYDNRILPLPQLLELLEESEKRLVDEKDKPVKNRIVHLPLSWDDPSTQLAIDKYTQSVRADAPWCPSNIEFIRRINGLDSIEDVKKIVFDADYLVMGLGDVYLGAPVATPMDPRHRLVTTKYNPARTWTPENAVGIGGAYLCVYGMEGPGGYQFVGRTLQMWNKFNSTREFEPGKPWLLRFFDQIKFYPVSHRELMEMRRDFPHGLCEITIEDSTFDPLAYQDFLLKNKLSIDEFKTKQQRAFEQERQQWLKNGHFNFESKEPEDISSGEESALLPGCDPVISPVAGSMWKLLAGVDTEVERDEVIAIVECMKMEISLKAPCNGTVKQVLIAEGERVFSGQQLFALMPN